MTYPQLHPEPAGSPRTILPEWREYFGQGDQFLALAAKGVDRLDKFNGEALYNLLAMAMEKHFMALFLQRGRLPEGHTLHELIQAADGLIRVDLRLLEEISVMDSFQEICSNDEFVKKTPSTVELKRFIDCARRLRTCIHEQLPLSSPSPC